MVHVHLKRVSKYHSPDAEPQGISPRKTPQATFFVAFGATGVAASAADAVPNISDKALSKLSKAEDKESAACSARAPSSLSSSRITRFSLRSCFASLSSCCTPMVEIKVMRSSILRNAKRQVR